MNRFKSWIAFICLSIVVQAHAQPYLYPFFGEKIPFSSLTGKWVFINYWASWCPSCLDEIPALNRFYAQHKTSDVMLFAINYDGLPISSQQQLIKQFNILYPSLKKNPASALHLGNINAVPVTFVFNPQGVLIEKLYGGQTTASLNHVLAKHAKP